MSQIISPAQQKQLDAAGYVVIPEVLSDAEIKSYRARILALADAERADRDIAVARHAEQKATVCAQSVLGSGVWEID